MKDFGSIEFVKNPPSKGECEHDECRVSSGDVHPSRLKADYPQPENNLSTAPLKWVFWVYTLLASRNVGVPTAITSETPTARGRLLALSMFKGLGMTISQVCFSAKYLKIELNTQNKYAISSAN